jgi:hypothetical protein
MIIQVFKNEGFETKILTCLMVSLFSLLASNMFTLVPTAHGSQTLMSSSLLKKDFYGVDMNTSDDLIKSVALFSPPHTETKMSTNSMVGNNANMPKPADTTTANNNGNNTNNIPVASIQTSSSTTNQTKQPKAASLPSLTPHISNTGPIANAGEDQSVKEYRR